MARKQHFQTFSMWESYELFVDFMARVNIQGESEEAQKITEMNENSTTSVFSFNYSDVHHGQKPSPQTVVFKIRTGVMLSWKHKSAIHVEP